MLFLSHSLKAKRPFVAMARRTSRPRQRGAFAFLRQTLSILAPACRFLGVAAYLIAFVAITAQPARAQNDQVKQLNRRVIELYRAGRYEEAVPLAERVLEMREHTLPPDHADIGTSLANLGSIYLALGEMTKAESSLRRALEIHERALPAGHRDIATSLNILAGLYHAQGRLAEAETNYKRAFEMREKVLPPGDPELATSLNNLASVYRDQGRLAEAESSYNRALDIWKRVWPNGHANIAMGLSNLADLYQAQRRVIDAEVAYNSALDVWEKALPEGHPGFAATLDKIGKLYQAKGQFSEAERSLKRALEIREHILPPGHPDIGTTLDALAAIYANEGRFAEVEETYLRGIEAREVSSSQRPVALAQSLITLASFYHSQGRLAEAEPLYKRTLEILQKAMPRGAAGIATALDRLGFLYEGQWRLEEAETLYRRALDMREKLLGPTNPNVAASLDNLAYVYGMQGRFADAESLLKRALEILEKTLPANNRAAARSLNNLGMLYQRQGRLAEAEPLYERALQIREKEPQADAELASSLANLAALRFAQERLSDAELLQRRALALREKVLPPDHPEIATSLHGLAAFYFSKGDWKTATEYWRRAVSIIVERTRRASRTGEVRAIETSRGETLHSAVLFDGLLHAAWRVSEHTPERRTSLSQETFVAAQWKQQTSAGEALAQMASRFARGEGELSDIVRDQQNLTALWERLDKQIIAARALPPEQRNTTTEEGLTSRQLATDRELKAINARLSREFPDYVVLAAPEPLSLAETQKQLQADEALVLFAVSRQPQGFAWIVTKTEARWVRIDFGEQALSTQVQTLRCGLDEEEWATVSRAAECGTLLNQEFPDRSRPLPFDLGLAHSLYRKLFGQFEDLIKDKRLLVVPSGPLTSLPLHVLVTGKPTTALPNTFDGYRDVAWLGRSFAITILPTIASLKALRETAARAEIAPDDYIGYGNPLLKGDSTLCRNAKVPDACPQVDTVGDKPITAAASGRATIRGHGGRRSASVDTVFSNGATTREIIEQVRSLCPLPDTAYEIKCVAAKFKEAARSIHLDSSAREDELKELSIKGGLARYRIVHFATHGLLAGDVEVMTKRQGEPALVMTPPDVPKDADDDGLITASEVAQLKLKADWVVLSACNTAAGDRSGAEALSGLARAFFYAGARALLVSHWPVYSDAAVQLTSRVFAELDRNPAVGRAKALQRAMIELMDDASHSDNAHPAVWAPFVIVGEGAR